MSAPSRLGIENPLHGNAFRVEHIMGMPFSIDIRDQVAHQRRAETEAVLDRCFDALRRADSTFSLWRTDTPMARLSAGAASLAEMPADVVEVLRRCVQAAARTGGAFRARRPDGRVDPSGLVKGWAIARAGRILQRAGMKHWCVNGAGDVLVHGQARPGEPWAIGIVDPDQTGQLLDAVRLTRGAVATSGPAERGSHLWNPLADNTFRPVRSVSVLSRDIVTADVLATAATAYGDRAVAWLADQPGAEGIAVLGDGRVESTSGWVSWTERV